MSAVLLMFGVLMTLLAGLLVLSGSILGATVIGTIGLAAFETRVLLLEGSEQRRLAARS